MARRDREPGPVVLHGRGQERLAQERPGGVVGLHGAAVAVPDDVGRRPSIFTRARAGTGWPGCSRFSRRPGRPGRAAGRSRSAEPEPPRAQTSRIGKVVAGVRRGRAVPARVGGDPPWARRCRRWCRPGTGRSGRTRRPGPAGSEVLAPDRPPAAAGCHHVPLGGGAIEAHVGREQPAPDPVALPLGDAEVQGGVHVEQVGAGGVPGHRDHEAAVGGRLHGPAGPRPLEVADGEVLVAVAPQVRSRGSPRRRPAPGRR